MTSAVEFKDLVGVTLQSVTVNKSNDRIDFKATDGRAWVLYHQDDCCESVTIEDITGDLADLVDTPILFAEEATNSDDPRNDTSWTWTFYKLRTIKGSVTIRWYGTSNGYYSESVTFERVREGG